MKKWIHASENHKINKSQFASSLVEEFRNMLAKEFWPRANLTYDEIMMERSLLPEKLKSDTMSALRRMGYQVYDISRKDDEGYDIAAVDDTLSYVKLYLYPGTDYEDGDGAYININYDNDDIFNEDWYFNYD